MEFLLAAVEEKFLKGYRVPALLAVGLEVGGILLARRSGCRRSSGYSRENSP